MDKAKTTVWSKRLQITVVVGALLLAGSKWMVGGDVDDYGTTTAEHQDAARNERSTPRAFVLPATPGVAFEQERQHAERARQAHLATRHTKVCGPGTHAVGREALRHAPSVDAGETSQVGRDMPASEQPAEDIMRELPCH